MHDAVVIGAGPAGLSAAIYLARSRLKTLVVGSPETARLWRAKEIDNYLGFPNGITGRELLDLGTEQARRFGAEFCREEVVGIRFEEPFSVQAASGEKWPARAVVLTTGVAAKPSGIAREEELVGQGISYCVVCDGFFFRNQPVAVVGPGNFAASEALELLPFTRQIILFSNGRPFSLNQEMEARLAEEGIGKRTEKVLEFVGDGRLEGLRLETGEVVPVNGAFMALGTASSLDFARSLGVLIENNAVVIDRDGRTNVPGIFAAGDCTGGALQVAKAVGEGCSAALAAIAHLRQKKS
ncbi:MAG: FAD-dependent oxidoreductase [Bacteroidetes bacterium]|nr:FAD-dependent oxidoreductase [Bacteroidota bacterium]